MKNRALRVVFDTNIFISAFNWEGGNPEQAYRAAVKGIFTLITSPWIVAETARKLREKFFWHEENIVRKIKEIARKSEIVKPNEKIDDIEEDESDNRILECAVAGKAHLIVSGDKDLLRLKEYRGIPIIRAASFMHIVQEKK